MTPCNPAPAPPFFSNEKLREAQTRHHTKHGTGPAERIPSLRALNIFESQNSRLDLTFGLDSDCSACPMSSSSANPVVYNAEGATSVSRDSSRPNVYRRPVDSAWGNEFGGLFGGYTTAVALRALQRHFTRNPDPLTLSLTYIAAPTSPGGDLEIEIEENKTGRTFAFAGVKVFWLPPEKSGKTRVILLAGVATMGNLGAARNSPSFRERRPLLGSGYKAEADYPPPEECLDRIGADAPRPFMRHFKFRESPAGVERTKRESSRIDKERLDENVVEHAAWYGELHFERSVLALGRL